MRNCFDAENNSSAQVDPARTCELFDGNTVAVDAKRLRLRGSIAGSIGFHDSSFLNGMKRGVYTRKDLYANAVFSGGVRFFC